MEIQKRYQVLFQNSPDGIVYFDKDYKILEVNKTFVKLFGYSYEECIGKDLDDMVMPVEKRNKAKEKTIELFRKGIVDVEDIRYKKTEDPIYVNIRGILVRVGNQIEGGYAIYTDITEKIRYKEELELVNEDLEAIVHQLIAGEEELQTQYAEIQRYTEYLEELKQKYEIAIKGIDSGIWEVDAEDERVYLSENFAKLVSIDLDETSNIYEVLDKVVVPEDKNVLLRDYKRYKRGEKEQIYCQVRIIDKDGKVRWFLVSGKGVTNRDGDVKALHGVLVEISQIRKQEEKIKFLAYHDSLTHLPNRRKFIDILKEEIENNKKGTVMLLDLDNFKKVNDSLGHAYGDELIKKVAGILVDIAEDKMTVFRFGGDEFLILIKNQDDPIELEEYADNILLALQHNIVITEIEDSISASIGIVRYPNDSNTIDDILMRADISMYQAKITGKNR